MIKNEGVAYPPPKDMDVYRNDKFYLLWRSCLTALMAMVYLPAAAQDAAAEEGAEDAPADRHFAAEASRHERAMAMAKTLIVSGMEPKLAEKYAYAALAAEARGEGEAEKLLSKVVEQISPEEMTALLSDEELTRMLLAEEERKAFSASLADLWEKMLKSWENAQNPALPTVAMGGTVVHGEAETTPSVWWLENFSGSILQQEPAMPMFMPPPAPAGMKYGSRPAQKEEKQPTATTLTLGDEEEESI